MIDIQRCQGCPIVGQCAVERTGHRTYCDWAKRGGKWLAKVRELSGEARVSYPPVLATLANAAEAGGRLVAAIATGRPILADTAEAERRLAICEEPCERYDAAQGRCLQCGCFVAYKVRLASEAGQCPLGKW